MKLSRKKGLGRGLDAIFIDNEGAQNEEKNIATLAISSIEPKSDQPRKAFEGEALSQLAESIQQHGVLQPILVREVGGRYSIIAGERRWRASKLAGLSEIPAIVVEADDFEAAQLALIENIQREDLTPYEEAMAYQMLIRDFGLTQEELSVRVGKSRSAVANMLRLLDLPDEILEFVKNGSLSAGHARALLGLKDRSEMETLAIRVIKRNLSVRETEAAVKAYNRGAQTKPNAENDKFGYIEDLERRASGLTGRRIRISDGAKKALHIEFTDNSDLEELLVKLCGNGIVEK